MDKAKVVIGGMYGDEGKGLFTDYFAEKESADLVVRFNGGAQAGHTVHRDGKRHVFSHFGSGSLLNVTTFLAQDFVVNPIFFNRELEILEDLGQSPTTIIDWRCKVTTPWDMMLNQIRERIRGNWRHGSCGFGINETIVRSQKWFTDLRMVDLYHRPSDLKERIGATRILHGHAAEDLDATAEELEAFHDPLVFKNFEDDIDAMCAAVSVNSEQVVKDSSSVVFEGAQGLLLDQYNEDEFPHVTRSSTGLQNVTRLLWDIQQTENVEVVYLTRCYQTRHGAGRLDDEVQIDELESIVVDDDTNVTNPYQGTLRFAEFDDTKFIQTVMDDRGKYGRDNYTYSIGVTHLDTMVPDSVYPLLNSLYEYAGQFFDTTYSSFGKSAKTVKVWTP